jgi:hypothetical protein
LNVPDDKVGKKGRCPKCGTVFEVPFGLAGAGESARPEGAAQSSAPAAPTVGAAASAPPRKRSLVLPIAIGSAVAVAAAAVAVVVLVWNPAPSGPLYGQSFNVIQDVSGDSYVLDGYTSFADSKSRAFSPNAVLVVGVPEGVTLGGRHFDQGSIVVVEGEASHPTFRLARPRDRIALLSEVTIFGKKHAVGVFEVPRGGKLVPASSGTPGKSAAPGPSEGGTAKRAASPRDYKNVGMDATGSEVTSDFRGTKYHAKVARGGMDIGPTASLVFSGIVSGEQTANNEPSPLWRQIKDSQTRCAILDYEAPRFLVKGDVETIQNQSLFLAPGSILENATLRKTAVRLARPNGGAPYELVYGEKVQVDENGDIRSLTKR